MNDKLKNIIEPEFIKRMDMLVAELIQDDLKKESLELVNTINEIFAQNRDFEKLYPDHFKRYEEYLTKAKFIALPMLEEKDILRLLELHFSEVFEIPEYDLYTKIKEKLVGMYDLAERDAFKNKIKSLLLKDTTMITKKDLSIGEEKSKPTIYAWLKDYNLRLGTGPVDKLKQTQYFTNSENTRGLAAGEINRLKQLFGLYEKLKKSSNTPEGIEESVVAILPNGEINLVVEGKPEKIDPKITKALEKVRKIKGDDDEENISNDADYLRELAQKYPQNSLERKAIDEEINRLSRET